MKFTAIIPVLFCTFNTFASPADSVKRTGPFRDFNIGVNLVELGASVLFNPYANDGLASGVEEFWNIKRLGSHTAYLGLNIYYKKRFGIRVEPQNKSFSADPSVYQAYLTSRYPDYHVPNFAHGRELVFMTLATSLSYRRYFRYFVLEPRITVGFNAVDASNYFPFRLKEVGSNQYVEIDLDEQLIGLKNSYHLGLDIAHVFGYVELGLHSELFCAPTLTRFSISEKPYGQAAQVTEVQLKNLNAGVALALTASFLF